MARRICFALDLVADAALIADYEKAHAAGAAWPEVTAAIRAKGFTAMEIWRTGDRLVMIAEVTDDWPRAIPAELAAVDTRWEAAMDRFQKPLPHAAPGEKWVAMERIYSLDAQ
ncbi:L-rhamnose mutarotase [uncultured Sphingomonas sp.]|uniref:L-rhamnose mutarotase n=1 Tax=uncultured Sphingomonas sp. TaxID=158754 RepID=UPI0025F95369|nr:L-rhamnose mutarotase [uncultured Sphingomonas sp.]